MKIKLIIPVFVLSLVLSPFVGNAEEVRTNRGPGQISTSSQWYKEKSEEAKKEFELRKKEIETKREALKEEIEKRREEMKKELEDRKENIRGEVEKRREENLQKIQEKASKFIKNVLERYEAAIERIEKLASRIETRITKMESDQIDVKKAKELMLIAKVKIETAKTSVAGVKLDAELVSTSTATTTSAFKADFQKFRTQLENAKKDIKAAHAALVEVINNLKPGLNKATSTATTTNP